MTDGAKESYGKLFHALTNRQNIVSVKAGALVILSDQTDYVAMSKEELIGEVTKMREELRLIERAVLEAGQFASKLDDLVWPVMKTKEPDDSKKPA